MYPPTRICVNTYTSIIYIYDVNLCVRTMMISNGVNHGNHNNIKSRNGAEENEGFNRLVPNESESNVKSDERVEAERSNKMAVG